MVEAVFDRTQLRILGTLIEKSFTVPDTYPLSLNSLVSGCNQKSNRDPVIEIPDYHIEGALKALFVDGWAGQRTRDGGRVVRWNHRLGEKLSLDRRQLAILAELMLRGPQAVGALRGRATRMAPFNTVEEATSVLNGLRERGFVTLLVRRPGERAQRWAHQIGKPTPEDEEAESPEVATPPPPAAQAMTPTPPSPPPSVQTVESDERVDALEAEVAELRNEVERLRSDLDALRGL